ncbi:YutD family protein [Apilactobacillus bombintestini]|uniref:DUF1027 domain-containing protein n=1 Tax=Apilactobacillus bombintestini TaxID=2419772 RepID=A0A387ASW6_9LACO|nr:YutD family protein [Apilactobacillus bombintestini]AYF92728.1 DUF1027 domain-containing protein [Apilactobacillus bombintestini]
MDRKSIEDLVEEKRENAKPLAHIKMGEQNNILINGHDYEIMDNQNDCFNLDDFSRQYNPIFSRYSYIVGDYGYGVLRLKGFSEDGTHTPLQNQFSAINDYLYEYANMGADYFVLHNLEVKSKPIATKKRHRRNRKNNRRPFIKEKVTTDKGPLNKRKRLTVTKSEGHGKRHFTIKQRED